MSSGRAAVSDAAQPAGHGVARSAIFGCPPGCRDGHVPNCTVQAREDVIVTSRPDHRARLSRCNRLTQSSAVGLPADHSLEMESLESCICPSWASPWAYSTRSKYGGDVRTRCTDSSFTGPIARASPRTMRCDVVHGASATTRLVAGLVGVPPYVASPTGFGPFSVSGSVALLRAA